LGLGGNQGGRLSSGLLCYSRLGKGRELALQLHRDAMPAPPFIKRTVRTVSVARSIADLFEEPIVSVMRALGFSSDDF
jgi:hypothetical protein